MITQHNSSPANNTFGRSSAILFGVRRKDRKFVPSAEADKGPVSKYSRIGD